MNLSHINECRCESNAQLNIDTVPACLYEITYNLNWMSKFAVFQEMEKTALYFIHDQILPVENKHHAGW